MEFYPNRTVDEQAERLPLDFQENYRRTTLDKVQIDGVEISGYFDYSFMEEKSYVEQPVRSQNGVIVDLDNYSTFLTPRLIIKYNMMNIEDYRKLMKLLKSKNSFNVTCYDIVEDKRVTHEMYFAPPAMPIIYQQYLAALGIREYTIELIGTNRGNITFYIQGKSYGAYTDDTWDIFVNRGETSYKSIYSSSLGQYIVTSDSGSTAIWYDNSYVSPEDIIVADRNYEVALL